MKHIITVIISLNLLTHIEYLNAVCTLGSLTPASGSPYNTWGAVSPESIAYSPLIDGHAFLAISNAQPAIAMHQVNSSTGVPTAVNGSPFAITGSSAPLSMALAFSPPINNKLFLAAIESNTNNINVFSVDPISGNLTAVPGSPFAAGGIGSFAIVAYSPIVNGNLFAAVTNTGANSVSVYKVDPISGAFTQITGSPFTTGNNATGVAYSPFINGNLFAAVTNQTDGTVSVYSVNTTTGVFTQVTGSPFTAGSQPLSVAFSPNLSGTLFAAVANIVSRTVSVYQVNTTTGAFTQVSGSPFTTSGSTPRSIAFSPLIGGNLFVSAANAASSTIAMYQVNTSTGFLTPVSGSPFSTGTSPESVAFSPILPGGLFVATANLSGENASVFQVATLLPTLTTLSQYILSGNTITLNGTISGGTQPYAITWQDSTVQSGISTTTFSRGVSPTISTIYDVATITDTNSCTAGPSNNVTIAVRTCP